MALELYTTHRDLATVKPSGHPLAGAPRARPNEIPKVVFSKTLTNAPWPESSIASGELAAEIGALKEQPGGEIIAWGGAGFARALTSAGLVDQYAIIHQPVAYGGGEPIFRDLPDALHLNLVAATTFSTGTMLHLYEPRGWGAQVDG
jgi:dihydrofolate reductase